MDTSEQIDRLIAEVLQIIPSVTSGRGSFNTMPELGYTARHPGEWQREFLSVVDGDYLAALRPDTDLILGLVRLVNQSALAGVPPSDVSFETLSSVVGYVVLEMLIRRVTPAIDEWGYLVQPVEGLKLDRRVSALRDVLDAFEETTLLQELRRDLQQLNSRMSSEELDRNGRPETLNLYGRIEKGRNLMLHGNLTHSFEGNLLVLLIDLIVLHAMKHELRQNRTGSA